MTHDLKAERAGLGRRLDVRRGTVDMTHGSGGRASAQLIGELFAKHLTNEWLRSGPRRRCHAAYRQTGSRFL